MVIEAADGVGNQDLDCHLVQDVDNITHQLQQSVLLCLFALFHAPHLVLLILTLVLIFSLEVEAVDLLKYQQQNLFSGPHEVITHQLAYKDRGGVCKVVQHFEICHDLSELDDLLGGFQVVPLVFLHSFGFLELLVATEGEGVELVGALELILVDL